MYYWDGATFYAWDDDAAASGRTAALGRNGDESETRVSLTTTAGFTVNVTAGTALLVFASIGDVIVHSDLPAGTTITGIAANYASCTVSNAGTGVVDGNAYVRHITKVHTPGAHSRAEFCTFFPRVYTGGVLYKAAPIAAMVDVDGNGTTANRVFLLNDNVVNGGKVGVDNYYTTTWDDRGAGYFLMTNGSKTFTNRTNATTVYSKVYWGSKIGTGDRTIGVDGVRYWQNSGNMALLQDWECYGCEFVANNGTINVSNATANTNMVFGACYFEANALLLWGTGATGIKAYNCVGVSRRTSGSNFVNAADFEDSYNVLLGSKGQCDYAMQTAGTNRNPRNVIFASDQKYGDINLTGAGQGWNFVQSRRSGAAQLVFFSSTNISSEGSGALRNVVRLHTRIMDDLGEPIANVPVHLRSTGKDYNSVDGYDLWEYSTPILTSASGDISWTYIHLNAGSTPNGIVPRSYGSDGSSAEYYVDRVFTMLINQPDMTGYISYLPSRKIVFTVPGRDLKQGVYSDHFGDFEPELWLPIELRCDSGRTATFDEVECDA